MPTGKVTSPKWSAVGANPSKAHLGLAPSERKLQQPNRVRRARPPMERDHRLGSSSAVGTESQFGSLTLTVLTSNSLKVKAMYCYAPQPLSHPRTRRDHYWAPQT